MNPNLPQATARRLELPFRRVLAVDAGSRRIKLLWLESRLGRLRILSEQSLDLREEGLTSSGELATYLASTRGELGHPPLAITLPQHLSTSQLIGLPPAPETEVRKQIEEETLKLSGVSESAILFDFVPLRPLAAHRQHFWVTVCQEGDIRDQIERLGLQQEELCEVTTTANALLATWLDLPSRIPDAVLVHVGAQTTVVVVVVDGQGVFASSFPMGGDFFARNLANSNACSLEHAEHLKRSKNLFSGEDARPDFLTVVDGWLAELIRQLQEWFEGAHGRSRRLASFQIITGGGAAAQPGFLEFLRDRSGFQFVRWPPGNDADAEVPAAGFEVAYGTALQALGRSAQPASLLPAGPRLAGQKRLIRQWLGLANAALLVILGLVLLTGIWQQLRANQRNTALLDKVHTSLAQVQESDALTDELLTQYAQLRPLFVRQKHTLDTLKTLALLQQSRSNRSFWYVLFADQRSYFTTPFSVVVTNHPGQTNQTVVTNLVTPASTNLPPLKPGFIAELCVPEEVDAARATFSQLVNSLGQQTMFGKVDSVSGDLRRNLADPQVLLPGRHFALALELADAKYLQPVIRRRKPLTVRTNGFSPMPGRFPKPDPDAGGYPGWSPSP